MSASRLSGWCLGLGCAVAAGVVGCQPAVLDSKSSPAGPAAPASVAAAAPHDAVISLKLGERADLDRLVAAEHGKYVLVDFWATWCGPCREQFPRTVAWSRANRNTLQVISVSLDDPEEQSQVLAFLCAQAADFPNLLSTYGVGLAGFAAFEVGSEGIPFYHLYDRDGRRLLATNDHRRLAEKLAELGLQSVPDAEAPPR